MPGSRDACATYIVDSQAWPHANIKSAECGSSVHSLSRGAIYGMSNNDDQRENWINSIIDSLVVSSHIRLLNTLCVAEG